jgi:flagellar basal-body rod protein FlgB
MADIAPPSLFGPTITLLQHAVKGAHLEHEQIANNLANVNTPNFERSTTNFKDALQASLGIPAPADELGLQTDDDRQFQVDDGSPPVPFDPQATVDETVQMRVDKSNVDVDQETTLLAANADYQSTVSQLVQQQYKFLREAIQEQTN